jgi:3-hydroxybutyryl-CoA dehydrogenase
MSEKIGVVGAGLMGAEIALVFALAGHDVLLSDRGEAELNTALERLARVLDRGIGRGFYKDEEKPAALSRIRTTTTLDEFADRDFVTEAVFESEEVKAEVYRALDRICEPRCILASNTSTIPISTLASYVGEARRPYFIGTHYFSPASRMKLVEVIPGFETAPETVETATRLMREADKVPVKVKDVAGFAVNRVFLIFLQEAVRLVEEAVRVDGCDDLAAGVAGIGDFARRLWRAVPPAGPVEAARAGRVCRRPRGQGLAEEIARVRKGR